MNPPNKPMNPEVKKLWVEALEIGKYKQGNYRLQAEEDTFCCLGVLCDLAVKTGVISPPVLDRDDDAGGFSFRFGENNKFLPTEVMEWAGLYSSNPRTEAGSLTMLNDVYGYDFKQIAKRIKEDL